MKYLLTLLLTSVMLLAQSAWARDTYIPRDCYKYQRDLMRESRFVFGLDAPVAMLAGQMHQESRCNPRAKSAYAEGLIQFTPDTAKWISNLFPDLGPADAFNPQWNMRAAMRYDNMLLKQNKIGKDLCNQWAFALTGYNGGQGWNTKDRKKAKLEGKDPTVFWGSVELVNAGRRPEFKRENIDYPRKIILKHQIHYYNDNWGGPLICSELQTR